MVINGGSSGPTPNNSGSPTSGYVSAIAAAKEAYKTGGVEAAKSAYGNVMAGGIKKASVGSSTYNEEAAKQQFKGQLESQGFVTDKLDYQWQIEKQQVAQQVARDMSLASCYGPPPITQSQAQKAISYYEGLGQYGKAGDIREFYTTRSGVGGTLGQIQRAVDIGYAPASLGSLGAYGGDLVSAYVDKAITDEDLQWLRDEGYLDEDSLSLVKTQGAVLLAVGPYCSEGGRCDLAGAIEAGAVSEEAVRQSQLFSEADVTRALTLSVGPETLPGGMRQSIAPQGKSFWKRGWEFMTPWKEEEGQTFKQWVFRPGTFLGDVSYMREMGTPFAVRKYPQEDYPKLIMGYGPMIMPAGGALGSILTGFGSRFGQVALGTTRGLIRTGFTSAGVSTVAAAIQGVRTPSKEGTWEGELQSRYQAYLASPEYLEEKARIEASGEYKAVPPTFEEFRGVVGTNVPLAYQGGVWGTLGRGWEAQTQAFANLRGDLPWYRPKALIAGMGGYLASPALAADLYTRYGSKAAVAAIPHFGPTWGYTGLEWGRLGPGQRALGVGMGFLPYVVGPLGTGARAVGTRFGAKFPKASAVLGSPVRAVRAVSWGTGVTPILATLERGAPWQLAYAAGRGFRYAPGPLGSMASKAISVGWLGSTTPLSSMWRKWFGEPALGFGKVAGGTEHYPQYSESSQFEVDPKTGRIVVPERFTAPPPTPKPTAAQTRLLARGAEWQWDAAYGQWRLGAPAGKVIVQEGGTGPLVVKDIGTVTSLELTSRFVPGPGVQLGGTSAPSAIVQEVGLPSFSSLLRSSLPVAGRIGAVGLIASVPALVGLSPLGASGLGYVQQQIGVVDGMLQQGKITQVQHAQLVQQIQQIQQQRLTQQEQQQQVQQVVKVVLTPQQQQEYQQVQQQIQQVQRQQVVQQQQQQVPIVQNIFQPQQLQIPLWQQQVQRVPTQETIVRPPFVPPLFPPMLFTSFGGGGGAGGRGGKPQGGLLGVGVWKFGGFKVSGPHPLRFGTTGYTWMGGVKRPWGVGKRVPEFGRKKSSGGLVRVV